MSGGLVRYHAGGADTEAPNHLSDLTLWNLEVTGTIDEKGINFASDFNGGMPEMFGGKYILLLWLEHMDKQLLSHKKKVS